MPDPAQYLRGLFNIPEMPPEPTPEQQAEYDVQALASQAQDPAWKRYARQGLETAVEGVRGLVGAGDEGAESHPGNKLGQLAGALPLAPGALKGLYSRVQRATEGLRDVVPTAKAASTLKNLSSGEELAYRKVPEFLAGQSQQVNRADLLSHLEQNPAPQVSTKVLGEPERLVHSTGGWQTLQPNPAPTKYGGYQVPGGQNYRETLLTLPGGIERQIPGESPGTFKMFPSESTYRSPHWDDPNVLAHVRTNERNLPPTPDQIPPDILSDTDPNWFGSRGRFIEEIQSDWHQQGKQHGYRTPPAELERITSEANSELGRAEAARLAYVHANPDVIGANLGDFPELDRLWQARTDAEDTLNQLRRSNDVRIPDAPFKDSWPDLALKQQLLDVAERPDLDWLGFTSGKTQADRYDLSKQISRVDWVPETGYLTAYDMSGNPVVEQIVKDPHKLPDWIGKDAAQRLVSQPLDPIGGTPRHRLEGENLQVGGEGMQEFYDRQLPRKLEKLLAPFGGKVEQGALPGPSEVPDYRTYFNPVVGTDQVYNPKGIMQPGEIGGEHLASVWPKTGLRDQKTAVDDAWDVLSRLMQQNTKTSQIPIWLAHLPPEMKAAILKKGLPLLSLMGLAYGQEPAVNPDDALAGLDQAR